MKCKDNKYRIVTLPEICVEAKESINNEIVDEDIQDNIKLSLPSSSSSTLLPSDSDILPNELLEAVSLI